MSECVIFVVFAVFLMVVTLMCLDIARLHPDDTHTVSSLLHMYHNFRFVWPANARKAQLQFERLAKDGRKAQVCSINIFSIQLKKNDERHEFI